MEKLIQTHLLTSDVCHLFGPLYAQPFSMPWERFYVKGELLKDREKEIERMGEIDRQRVNDGPMRAG